MQQALPIFSAKQIKEIDAYTISNEPILSIDLMERAALVCNSWITKHYNITTQFKVFCGLGNNGGDGLAIARQLLEQNYQVEVFVIQYSEKCSEDFLINKQRLQKQFPNHIYELSDITQFPNISMSDIIIDALFGIGLSKPLDGLAAECVSKMNSCQAKIIAIDVPSGLFIDKATSLSSSVVFAAHTLTFQFPKLAFLFAENCKYIGKGHILDIGLIVEVELKNNTDTFYIRENFIKQLLKPRQKYSHKGTFGHSLLMVGSYGKMGAAIMSAQSLLRSGAGLLTVCVPKCGYEIMQTSVPEAMVLVNGNEHLQLKELEIKNYSAIGIGPGIGPEIEAQQSVNVILENSKKPLVIDADALNAISLNKEWLKLIPEDSILTPHPKEFERLTKVVQNDFERHALQIEFSKLNKVYVVLKGAHTCITTPDGKSYFNSTGNSGLAKGGSGDVLTGLITGLLAQGYSPFDASVIGVFIHGLAGDMTKKEKGEIAMLPTDVIVNLPNAFMYLMKEDAIASNKVDLQ